MEQKTPEECFSTLLAVSQDLQTPFHIKCSFKIYGQKICSCSILIAGKSFTARADTKDEAIWLASKAAIIYCVKTFSIFEDCRKELKETESFCVPIKLDLLIPKKNELETTIS